MLYKVFVLYSPSHNKLFTGMTTSLGEQMTSFNGEQVVNGMSEYKPWTLVHMELFNNEGEASLREIYLKSPQGQAYVRSDILSLFGF